MSTTAEAIPAKEPVDVGQSVDGRSKPQIAATLIVAAAAMVATFPGRTMGLGFIEPALTSQFGLSELDFGHINFWATIFGAFACFPAGRMIDRYGLRITLFATALALGIVTRSMTAISSISLLVVLVTLTRAFGQSAMSVVSIAIVGKSFDRRKTWPMAAFSVLLTIGFMLTYPLLGSSVNDFGWRYAWSGLGIAVLLLAPMAWLLPKTLPTFAGEDSEGAVGHGFTLRQALATSAFWLFAVATSLFGLVAAGVMLFNVKILAERGLGFEAYYETAKIAAPFSLLGQALCGWLARKWTYQRLTTIGMMLYAASLLGLTIVASKEQLIVVSILTSFSGGMITVMFFAVFPRLFGRRELGRIQGAAQMLTVFASALGPVIFGAAKQYRETFQPAIFGCAAAVVLVAITALFVPTPKLNDEPAAT